MIVYDLILVESPKNPDPVTISLPSRTKSPAVEGEGECSSCGKTTKEKKLCSHRHHPYPQSPKPSQDSVSTTSQGQYRENFKHLLKIASDYFCKNSLQTV